MFACESWHWRLIINGGFGRNKPTEPIKVFSFFRDESGRPHLLPRCDVKPVSEVRHLLTFMAKTQVLRCCRAARAQHRPFPVAQASEHCRGSPLPAAMLSSRQAATASRRSEHACDR